MKSLRFSSEKCKENTEPYIQKAKKFADSAPQSKIFCGKSALISTTKTEKKTEKNRKNKEKQRKTEKNRENLVTLSVLRL